MQVLKNFSRYKEYMPNSEDGSLLGYNNKIRPNREKGNRQRMRTLATILLSCLLLVQPVFANTPMTITFQSTLATNQGLLNGEHRVIVGIHSGQAVKQGDWTEIHPSVLFVNGTCSIILGNRQALSESTLNINDPHFGISINGNTAFFPVPSTPYAIQAKIAETVQTLDAKNITGSFTNTVNINADLAVNTDTLFVDISANRVGIGTKTPTTPLDVDGIVNASGYKINGKDIESFLSWQKKNQNLFYNNGNVGIATENPSYKLDVAGTVNAREFRIQGIPISQVLSDALSWKPGVNKPDIYFNDGRVNEQGLVVGDVGIGTNNPLNRLDVRGAIRIGALASSSGSGTIEYANNDFFGYTPSGKVSLTGIKGSGQSKEILLWEDSDTVTGSSNLVWDYTNQRMGIGTANPTTQLSIKAVTDNHGLMLVKNKAGKTLFYISSQNVSIGSTTNNAKLNVAGVVDAQRYLVNGEDISRAFSSSSFWTEQNDGRVFYDKGNVGIGTNSPKNMLELAARTSQDAIISFDIGDQDLFSMGVEEKNPSAFIISSGADLNNPIIVFNQERIGLGIKDPSANLQVSGDNGVVFEGQFANGTPLTVKGAGTRMVWHPGKAAFRAGHVNSDQWDEEKIGTYSVALGVNSTANGLAASVVGGMNHSAAGDYSMVAGGFNNQALADYSFAAGHRAVAKHKGAFVWGDYTPTAAVSAFESAISNQFIIRAENGVGINTNQSAGSALTVKKDTEGDYIIRAVGNSSAPNALAITSSGNIGLGTNDPGLAKLAIMNGRVGIGTTQPTAALTVSTNANDQFVFVAYREDGVPAIFIRRDGKIAIGHPLDFSFPNDVTVAVAGSFGGPTFKKVDPKDPSASVIIGSNPGSPWAVPSENQNNTYFNRGSVGIGTATANSLLELSNANGRDPVITFDLDSIDRYSLGVTKNKFTIQSGGDLNSSNPPFSVDQNGVGIALSHKTPSASLHVGGTTILSGNVAIATTNTSTVHNVLIDGRLNTDQLYIGNQLFVQQPTPWKTNGLSNIYYTSGNVGIGTASPTAKLEVIGTVSTNQLIHTNAFTLNGNLQTNLLKMKDSSSNVVQYGSLGVENEELIYTNPSGLPKVISSPLRRDNSTQLNGYLAHWSDQSTIGVTDIFWDRNKKEINVSGNIISQINHSEPNGFILNSKVSMGQPEAISVVATLNHSGDLRNVKSYTAENIEVNVGQNWGNLNEVVQVKGLDVKLTQESNSLILNNAEVIGLNVDVSSVNVNTSQGARKAAAIFRGGNVGIGTTNPKTSLEVNGTVSANFFNLSGGLFVPELFINENALVAYKDINNNNATRVGIGTSTPTSELDVVGQISGNILSVSGGATATTLNINNGSLFVNASGNIGIGTTEPNGQIELKKTLTTSPTTPFVSEKINIAIDGAGTDQTFAFNNDITGLDIAFSSGVGSQLGNAQTAKGLNIDTSSLDLATGSTAIGLKVDVTGTGDKRYAAIFQGGRVGIGLENPLAELHVSGDVIAKNLFLEENLESDRATFNRLIINKTGLFNGQVTINTLEVTGVLTANTIVLETALQAKEATFSTINANTVSVNKLAKTKDLSIETTLNANTAIFSGGVGIGTTTAPASGLIVNGIITANSVAALNEMRVDSGTLNVNSATLFTGASNNVGIGTSAPQSKLHIADSNSTIFNAENTRTWGTLRIQNKKNVQNTVAGILLVPDSRTPSNSIGSGIIAVRSNSNSNKPASDLMFLTDPDDNTPQVRMTITNKGLVGIGTQIPNSALHVAGSAAFDGTVTTDILSVSTIQSRSTTVTIDPTESVVVKGHVSANALIEMGSGLRLKAGPAPSATTGYGIIYANQTDNDLYYLKPDGSSVNISQAYTGIANSVPYFDSKGNLNDTAKLSWNDTTKTFKVGDDSTLTKVEVDGTIQNTVTGDIVAEEITMRFADRNQTAQSTFKGLQISFEGQTPNDPDNFGRLAQDETAIGLEVDVTSLAAGRSTAQINGSTIKGKKYSAVFLGGSVGVGLLEPAATLHVASEVTGNPALIVDTIRQDSTLIKNALVVSGNSFVGVGVANPTAQLHVQTINDPAIADSARAAFEVINTDNETLLIVKNDGKVGIGTANPTEALDVAGTISANVGVFKSLTATTLNVGNGKLFVNQNGDIGIGTTTVDDANIVFRKSLDSTTAADFTSQKMNISIDGGSPSLLFSLNRNITGLDINIDSQSNSQLQSDVVAKGIDVDMSNLIVTTGNKATGVYVDVSGTTGTRYAGVFLGGNVGIGTANPTETLSVSGNITATNLTLKGDLIANTITTNKLAVLTDAIFKGQVTTNYLEAKTVSANNITLTGTVRISTASVITLNTLVATFNQLGVGISRLPLTPLEVSGDMILKSGRLAIGHFEPSASIHIKGTDTTTPLFRADIENTSTSIENAFYIDANGNMGIASGNPSAKLAIKTSDSLADSAALDIFNNSNNSLLRLMNDGKMGIGNRTPSATVHIVGTSPLRIDSNTRDNVMLVTNNRVGFNVSNPETTLHVSGNIPFKVGNNTVKNALWVNSVGNVGMGVDTLNFNLNVSKNILVGNASNATVPTFISDANTVGLIAAQNTDTAFFGLREKSVNADDYNAILQWGDSNTDSLLFNNHSDTTVMTIQGDGKVGINTTANAQLQVSGNNTLLIVGNSSVPNALIVTKNGRVGIHTPSPDAALHVSGNVIANSLTIDKDSVTVSTLNLTQHLSVRRTITSDVAVTFQDMDLTLDEDINNDIIGLDININSSDHPSLARKHSVYNSTAYGIRVDMRNLGVEDPTLGNSSIGQKYAASFLGGNVGIGTTDPSATLQVVGDAQSNLANFGTLTTDLSIKDYSNGVIGFNVRDLGTENPAIHEALIFDKDRVGIGFNPSSETNSSVKLVVDGDVRIGALTAGTSTTLPAYGNFLRFSGAPDISSASNSDNDSPLWIARYNSALNESELRINAGDGDGQDRFVVGATLSSTYRPIFQVVPSDSAGISYTGISDGKSTTFRPENPLHVFGNTNGSASDPKNHLMVIQNSGGDEADSLVIWHTGYANASLVPTNSNFISFADQSSVIGEIEGSTGSGIRFKTNGADYAEYLPKANKNETFKKGDVVGVRNGKISKNTKDAQHIMVLSSAASVAGNWPGEDKEKDYELVAFFGQVKVNVIGPVNEGDFLIASQRNDGSAIAVDKNAITSEHMKDIVGQAWESDTTLGDKKVLAGVGFNFSTAKLENRLDNIDDLEATLQSVKNEQKDLEKRLLETLDAQGKEIDALINALK